MTPMPNHIVEAAPNTPARRTMNPSLKFALELGPLLVFFFANYRGEWLAARVPALAALGGPIFIATALFMLATVTALSVSWALTKTLPIMPLVSGVFVLVFGGLTLWLQNDVFIKMKPTIVNLIFAATLLGGLLFGKSLLGYVFDQAFKLDDAGWRKLTLRWGVFFLVMAVVNELVWRGANFYYLDHLQLVDRDAAKAAANSFWANFKVWATMPITMIFMLFQIPLLQRHATEPLVEDRPPPNA